MVFVSDSWIRPFLTFHEFPHALVTRKHSKHLMKHTCSFMVPTSTSCFLRETELPVASGSHCHSDGKTRVGSLRNCPRITTPALSNLSISATSREICIRNRVGQKSWGIFRGFTFFAFLSPRSTCTYS